MAKEIYTLETERLQTHTLNAYTNKTRSHELPPGRLANVAAAVGGQAGLCRKENTFSLLLTIKQVLNFLS